jgi:hypothetical protein
MTDIVFIHPNQQQLFHHLLDVRHLKNTTNVEVVVWNYVLISIVLLYVHRRGVTSAAFVKKDYIEMKKEFVFQNLNVKSMNPKPHRHLHFHPHHLLHYHLLQDVRPGNCITSVEVVVTNLVIMWTIHRFVLRADAMSAVSANLIYSEMKRVFVYP